jgi:hypothetical protein
MPGRFIRLTKKLKEIHLNSKIMTQLNVEPKRNNNRWIWVSVIIAVFLLWWFFIRKDNQMGNMRLTPIADSTMMNDSTVTDIDTAGSMGDSAARVEHLSN